MIYDIAVNITDKNFKDKELIIEKSIKNGIIPIFVGSDVENSKIVLEMAKKYNTYCYTGIHPLDSLLNQDISIINQLRNDKYVLALGECGLDYNREKDENNRKIQIKIFEEQLKLKNDRYFLHCRDSHSDFIELIKKYKVEGVVHSFTGSVDEMMDCVENNLYIGLNGCSLRDNIKLVEEVPLNRLLLGTDSPYCKIKKSNIYYDFIETRFDDDLKHVNEPRHMHQLIEIVSKIRNLPKNDLISILNTNFKNLFKIQ